MTSWPPVSSAGTLLPQMWKRQPIVLAEVALTGTRRAAVRLTGDPSAMQARTLAAGAVALAAARLDDNGWATLRPAVIELAEAIAATSSGPLDPIARIPGRGGAEEVRLVAWEESMRPNVTLEVVHSASGPVPRRSRSSSSAAGALGMAALAVPAAIASHLTGNDRLGLAFTLEGVLAWLADSDRRAPARAGSAYALDHADRRIAELGERP